MKFLVVVLAFSGLCAATPEADPALLASPLAYNNLAINPYLNAYTYNNLAFNNLAYNRLAYAPNFLYNAAPFAAPIATPLIAAERTLGSPISPPAASVAPRTVATPAGVHVFNAADCVTDGGCRAKAILAETGRLFKRESDPQLITANPLAYNYGLSPYLGYAGALPLNPYTTNFPYLNRIAPYATPVAAPVAVPAAPVAVEAAPVAVEAAPVAVEAAPVVVKAAPVAVEAAPVAIPAAPVAVPAAPVAPVVYRQATPVVYRKPVAVPVVDEVAVPVTYEHIGKHPVRPTTVLETRKRVVGHQLF